MRKLKLLSKYSISPNEKDKGVKVMLGWEHLTKDTRTPWIKEFEKLQYVDFEQLQIEKEKLYSILEKLYEWEVIR